MSSPVASSAAKECCNNSRGAATGIAGARGPPPAEVARDLPALLRNHWRIPLFAAALAAAVVLAPGFGTTLHSAAALLLLAVWAASPNFSARFDATWRHYRYDVWNAPHANPFRASSAWHVVEPLSLPVLQLGCDPLVGEHDFTSFCRRPKTR